jgi:hypothetical protein
MCLRAQIVVELPATRRVAMDANMRHGHRSSFSGEFPLLRCKTGGWLAVYISPRQRARLQAFGRFKSQSTTASNRRSDRDYQVGTRMEQQKIRFEEKHVEGWQ